ncbi:MAG: hypothetical protein HKO66_02070 [Saprospiraceae bacterium]|nr:hypothetical protein [Bacteroidia bacterium]NNE16294.1 hypothetical protein [Saprospiraceae bacterium]NNL90998.1 hypothetical protein [Saprospiraceae bacterium]
MKNICLMFLGFVGMALFVSCNDEIPRTLTGQYVGIDAGNTNFIYLRKGDMQPVDFTAKVNLIAVPQTSPISYTFEIVDSLTDAIENIHYSIVSNSGSIAPGDASGLLPIQIIPDNIEQDESVELTVVLTSADVDLANTKPVTYRISVTCESDLAGTMNYSHENSLTSDVLTGTVELTVFDNMPGVYKFDDFSFGAWGAAYGIDPPTGTITFFHLCGVASIEGIDNYGDSWSLTEVLEADGPNFTFSWANDSSYNEFGTVTLTRQDGKDWPPIIK